MPKESVIKTKSFEFALKIIALSTFLSENKQFELGRQVLRSGTSIGANVFEAAAAQSRKDFVSKMSIASKEARETRYWLELLSQSKVVSFDFRELISNCQELINILTSIVKTIQDEQTPQ